MFILINTHVCLSVCVMKSEYGHMKFCCICMEESWKFSTYTFISFIHTSTLGLSAPANFMQIFGKAEEIAEQKMKLRNYYPCQVFLLFVFFFGCGKNISMFVGCVCVWNSQLIGGVMSCCCCFSPFWEWKQFPRYDWCRNLTLDMLSGIVLLVKWLWVFFWQKWGGTGKWHINEEWQA